MAVKTLFTIGSVTGNSTALLMEIGEDHCCYAFLNEGSKSFDRVSYVSFEEDGYEQELEEVLAGIGTAPSKVVVASAWPQALLTPQRLAAPGAGLLNVIYDGQPGQEFNDTIAEWQMVASYSLPTKVYDTLKASFPSASFLHVYTPALKMYNGFVAEDQIDICFTTRRFRVIVKKGNAVQLAQTYSYKTPLDVAYYLLKICYEFGIKQEEVFVIVSGLVDRDSALYAELHNYFLNVHFAQAASYELPQAELPHYYFTSLYNLAGCAL